MPVLKPQSSKYGAPKGYRSAALLNTKLMKPEVGAPEEGLEKAGEDFGDLPENSPDLANGGSKEAGKGGSEVIKGAPELPKAKGTSSQGPKKPGSSGGAKVGSVAALTKLVFHPKGGLGKAAAAKKPQGSSGFKDSGAKGPPQKTGASK